MLKKIGSCLVALTLAVGVVASSIQPAEAGHRGNFAAGVAAGVIGLGVLGAYAHAREREYYPRCHLGPEECGWRGRHCFENRYGEHVCRGGRYTCWRREYCD